MFNSNLNKNFLESFLDDIFKIEKFESKTMI